MAKDEAIHPAHVFHTSRPRFPYTLPTLSGPNTMSNKGLAFGPYFPPSSPRRWGRSEAPFGTGSVNGNRPRGRVGERTFHHNDTSHGAGVPSQARGGTVMPCARWDGLETLKTGKRASAK